MVEIAREQGAENYNRFLLSSIEDVELSLIFVLKKRHIWLSNFQAVFVDNNETLVYIKAKTCQHKKCIQSAHDIAFNFLFYWNLLPKNGIFRTLS